MPHRAPTLESFTLVVLQYSEPLKTDWDAVAQHYGYTRKNDTYDPLSPLRMTSCLDLSCSESTHTLLSHTFWMVTDINITKSWFDVHQVYLIHLERDCHILNQNWDWTETCSGWAVLLRTHDICGRSGSTRFHLHYLHGFHDMWTCLTTHSTHRFSRQ